MPTPVGHALAGLATAWFSSLRRSRDAGPPQRRGPSARFWPHVPWPPRRPTSTSSSTRIARTRHSIGASLICGAVAWGVARRQRSRSWTPETPAVRATVVGYSGAAVGLTLGLAYATHVLLDWLGKDTAPPFGLMALWPFSSRYFVSGIDLFTEISRRYWLPREFIYGNLRSVGRELVILGPIAAAAWWVSRRGSRPPRA